MKEHVTVIPSDNIIIVNGEGLFLPFSARKEIHAIQWHNGKGHIEFIDGDTPNHQIAGEEEYEREIAPFVRMWAEEKTRIEEEARRIEEEASKPPTLPEAIGAKLAEVMSKYSAAFAPIEAIYPLAEREGWMIQEAEARAVLADSSAETPVLSVLVQLRARGETTSDLALKVLENAAQWRAIYAYLTGQQQRMYAEVRALTAIEEVQTYVVRYVMPEGV